MAIEVISTWAGGGTVESSSFSENFSNSGNQVGDLLVCFVGGNVNSVNLPSGWTNVAYKTSPIRVRAYYKIATSVNETIPNATGTNSSYSLVNNGFMVIRGAAGITDGEFEALNSGGSSYTSAMNTSAEQDYIRVMAAASNSGNALLSTTSPYMTIGVRNKGMSIIYSDTRIGGTSTTNTYTLGYAGGGVAFAAFSAPTRKPVMYSYAF